MKSDKICRKSSVHSYSEIFTFDIFLYGWISARHSHPPPLYSEEDEAKAKEIGTNESAFFLAWLGLGRVILAQGLLLAASGNLSVHCD
ncbi:hypothetical protein DVH24_001777 [Malus domestica]|uniref:Uncharacterized protein n=1 Tax=Malus domestica TaxID=3750 RepID=A0A498I5T5_MALDO|nr:hypothetical protein DVH24_001777 [Malus domestica]